MSIPAGVNLGYIYIYFYLSYSIIYIYTYLLGASVVGYKEQPGAYKKAVYMYFPTIEFPLKAQGKKPKWCTWFLVGFPFLPLH